MLYSYYLKLIGELRKEKEFWQQCCQNSTKIGERKIKRWREKEEEFRQHCYRNSSTQIPARPVSYLIKKSNFDNAIVEIGKKRKFFFGNCGNGIAENGKKKIEWNYGYVITENGRKKKNFVAEIWEEIKKKCYVHNIFIILLQQITGD